MKPVTVYLPIEMDSGPHCPPGCVGNQKRRSLCTVFWEELEKARDHRGKVLHGTAGNVYKKCRDCILAVRQSQVPPDARKTIAGMWRPPPDVYKSE